MSGLWTTCSRCATKWKPGTPLGSQHFQGCLNDVIKLPYENRSDREKNKSIYLFVCFQFACTPFRSAKINSIGSCVKHWNRFSCAKVLCQKVTVTAWSKAWTVFARSNVGIVGWNPIWGMDVCVCLFCLCCPVCRQWPCDGLIPCPRDPTVYEKWLRNWIRSWKPIETKV
jgi:hypothetical protein